MATFQSKETRAMELEELRKKRLITQKVSDTDTSTSPINMSISMDTWFHKQRAETQLLKQKKLDAERNLHSYKGTVKDKEASAKTKEELRRKEMEAAEALHRYRGSGDSRSLLSSKSVSKERREKQKQKQEYVKPDVVAPVPSLKTYSPSDVGVGVGVYSASNSNVMATATITATATTPTNEKGGVEAEAVDNNNTTPATATTTSTMTKDSRVDSSADGSEWDMVLHSSASDDADDINKDKHQSQSPTISTSTSTPIPTSTTNNHDDDGGDNDNDNDNIINLTTINMDYNNNNTTTTTTNTSKQSQSPQMTSSSIAQSDASSFYMPSLAQETHEEQERYHDPMETNSITTTSQSITTMDQLSLVDGSGIYIGGGGCGSSTAMTADSYVFATDGLAASVNTIETLPVDGDHDHENNDEKEGHGHVDDDDDGGDGDEAFLDCYGDGDMTDGDDNGSDTKKSDDYETLPVQNIQHPNREGHHTHQHDALAAVDREDDGDKNEHCVKDGDENVDKVHQEQKEQSGDCDDCEPQCTNDIISSPESRNMETKTEEVKQEETQQLLQMQPPQQQQERKEQQNQKEQDIALPQAPPPESIVHTPTTKNTKSTDKIIQNNKIATTQTPSTTATATTSPSKPNNTINTINTTTSTEKTVNVSIEFGLITRIEDAPPIGSYQTPIKCCQVLDNLVAKMEKLAMQSLDLKTKAGTTTTTGPIETKKNVKKRGPNGGSSNTAAAMKTTVSSTTAALRSLKPSGGVGIGYGKKSKMKKNFNSSGSSSTSSPTRKGSGIVWGSPTKDDMSTNPVRFPILFTVGKDELFKAPSNRPGVVRHVVKAKIPVKVTSSTLTTVGNSNNNGDNDDDFGGNGAKSIIRGALRQAVTNGSLASSRGGN